MRGLSLVAASGGHSSSRCTGLSLSRPLLLWSTGSRCTGSVVVAHGPSCSAACGIFPDQGSNLCPLHWQADSQPLHHQGSPRPLFLYWLSVRMTYSLMQWGIKVPYSHCVIVNFFLYVCSYLLYIFMCFYVRYIFVYKWYHLFWLTLLSLCNVLICHVL